MNSLIKIIITLLFIFSYYISAAQHIQYRDKKKPVEKKNTTIENKVIPVADKSIIKDTSRVFIKSKAAFTMNPRKKKPFIEDQNMCNLMSRPEVAPQLPLVINNVSAEMIKTLKERYAGRLYSITGLNMIDERLKYKLKICDKDNGKFRSEYLDKDGNVVNDPDLDYE